MKIPHELTCSNIEMSGATYSQITNEEESVTFAPIEDDGDVSESMSTRSANSSLLERIQRQKLMQQTVSSPSLPPPFPIFQTTTPMPSSEEEQNIVDESEFEDSNYSYATSGGAKMNIPDYSSASSRNNFGNTYHQDDASDSQSIILNVFSAVANSAVSLAKSAYSGTKHVLTRAMKNGSRSTGGEVGLNRMNELDYQRESLLLDPHDIDDTLSFGTGRSQPAGLRGYDDSMSGSRDGMMGYIKHFCIDMKDLFLMSSRNVQIGVIVFFIFLIWLIVSEEEKWFG